MGSLSYISEVVKIEDHPPSHFFNNINKKLTIFKLSSCQNIIGQIKNHFEIDKQNVPNPSNTQHASNALNSQPVIPSVNPGLLNNQPVIPSANSGYQSTEMISKLNFLASFLASNQANKSLTSESPEPITNALDMNEKMGQSLAQSGASETNQSNVSPAALLSQAEVQRPVPLKVQSSDTGQALVSIKPDKKPSGPSKPPDPNQVVNPVSPSSTTSLTVPKKPQASVNPIVKKEKTDRRKKTPSSSTSLRRRRQAEESRVITPIEAPTAPDISYDEALTELSRVLRDDVSPPLVSLD